MFGKRNKAKRKLKNVTFDFKGAHIAYTDQSQGGAASLKNDPYLLKAKKTLKKEDLSEEQQEILAAIGEEFTPLDKNKESMDVEDNVNEKQDEDIMSEQIVKELETLKRKLRVAELEKDLSKYGLGDEVTQNLADTLADVEDVSGVTKALDTLIEKKQEELDKALENAKKEEPVNELQKSLDEEVGHEAKDETITKSFAEKVAEKIEMKQGGKQ